MYDHDAAAFFSIFAFIWIFVLAAAVGVHLFVGYCYKKIALKLGNDEDAKLWWIPVANTLILIRAAGRPDWWLVWSFIPFAGIIVSFILWIEVAQALGKPAVWGVIAALPVLIGPAYLAFSESDIPLRGLHEGDDVIIRWDE